MTAFPLEQPIHYPESDGQPMAESDLKRDRYERLGVENATDDCYEVRKFEEPARGENSLSALSGERRFGGAPVLGIRQQEPAQAMGISTK